MTSSKLQENQRTDIQALRALAVGAVLLFHIFPAWLPGGFVGVDIFFVISGFLITGQLWRQVQRDGRVNFKDFWARRARRLLPASLLVILVTLIAAFFLVPKSDFARFFADALASTFYVANWQFISKSTNYLEDTASPSPFQHFWSLSVEEQYYIIWPVLVFLAILLARLAKLNLQRTIFVLLIAVLVSSLWFSIGLTISDPAQAYFSTFTRAWEFAIGALLAVITLKPASQRVYAIGFHLGLVLIVVTLFAFSESTPFPSYWAAIPVVGTALMLWGGESKHIWKKFSESGPVQFIGNISYSLYLWHWPVLILLPWFWPGELSPVKAVVVLLSSVTLAWLSKSLVEDPVRFGAMARMRPLPQLAVTSGLLLAVSASSAGLAFAKENSYLNVAADQPTFELEFPTTKYDHSGCLVTKTGEDFKTCEGGVKTSDVRVALIGDSHMRQYWNVLETMAFRHGWNLTLISKSACPLQDSSTYAVTSTDQSCANWNQKLGNYLAEEPAFDLIVNSNASYYTQGQAEVSASYRKLVQREIAKGATWLLIKDNPKPLKEIEACLIAAKGDAAETCAISREKALLPKDDLPNAIKGLPNTVIVDLTDKFCNEICKPVIDGKVQYRDFSHISWSASLRVAPYVEELIPSKFKD